MSIEESIESKLREALAPTRLEVVNESHMHQVAADSETHFRVLVVTSRFAGVPLVQRHRMIYQLLQQERAQGLHALGIQTLTPEEFATSTRVTSPPCLGGDGTVSQ